MKSIWQSLGKVGYYVSLPALYLQLRWTKRTRVFIKAGDELLVVKGWLSRGDWSFPGGGLKRGENPAHGAVREVLEETGIALQPKNLTLLFEGQTTNPHKLTYYCYAFGVELKNKPEVAVRGLELVGAEWRRIDELLALPDADRLLKPALDAWRDVR